MPLEQREASRFRMEYADQTTGASSQVGFRTSRSLEGCQTAIRLPRALHEDQKEMLSCVRLSSLRGLRSVILAARLAGKTAYSTMNASTPYLTSPAELHHLQSSKETVILDATWFMPNAPLNAREDFAKRRIPRAQFLDLDEVASPHELGLKHMMPSGEVFSQACG